MKETTYYCDVCNKEADVDTILVQVIFETEQTEGRPCEPYFTADLIDMCEDCKEFRLKGNQVYGRGAQGYNVYEFKGERGE